METEPTRNGQQSRRPRHARAAILGELVLVLFLSAWILVEYVHNVYLQDYVKSTIDANASILQFAVPIGLAVVIASVYLQRRTESREGQAALRREEALRKINFAAAPPLPIEKVPHQLFTFPRPARDSNFRVRRKTKAKISRNRAGQRLPSEEQP